MKRKAILALENGIFFEGYSFGAEGEGQGELVFHTGMTGYQEILTDPSYKGQMVVMTYPHIGNTGINPQDHESDRIHLEGFIVKEYCEIPSNWRATQTLSSFLKEFHIPGIAGIDTRYLTQLLRSEGSLRGILSTQTEDPHPLIKKAKSLPPMEKQNLARTVSTSHAYQFHENGNPKYHVIAFDLGIKKSILQKLADEQCRVTVVPLITSAEEVLKLNPDGIFLSNGPGDPAAVQEMQPTLSKLIGKKPIFGICLGHQILAIALGGKIEKLKFGHHGANHPIQHHITQSIEITSQNHNFYVKAHSLPPSVEITHTNLNDHSIEGFRDREKNILSIQYHPEAAPGPHDSYYIFNQFVHMMEKQRCQSSTST